MAKGNRSPGLSVPWFDSTAGTVKLTLRTLVASAILCGSIFAVPTTATAAVEPAVAGSVGNGQIRCNFATDATGFVIYSLCSYDTALDGTGGWTPGAYTTCSNNCSGTYAPYHSGAFPGGAGGQYRRVWIGPNSDSPFGYVPEGYVFGATKHGHGAATLKPTANYTLFEPSNGGVTAECAEVVDAISDCVWLGQMSASSMTLPLSVFPGTTDPDAPEACDLLDVDWDPVGQQVVSTQRFTVTKPADADWDDLFVRASFSYGFDEFFSNNPARTSLYNAVQLGIYIEPVIVSTDGNTRTYSRTPYQPMDNDYFNVMCQPSDSFAGDDVVVYRRSNGDGGEPEPEGIRGLRPCLYVNMLFETPTSETRTVEFFVPSNAPLTMGDPGGIIDLQYGQVLDGGLRREVGPFDSFTDGAPPFTAGPVETAGTIDVTGVVDGEFGRQFVVCTDALGEVLFEEPQRPEDGGTTRGVGGPLLINPDAVDGWNTDVTLDPVSGEPIGDPVTGGTGGIGGDPDGGGTGGSDGPGAGVGAGACASDWGLNPFSWGGSFLDEMKCALHWAFVPGDDLNVSFGTFKDELFEQFPFSLIVLAEDFMGDLGNELENASGSGCFTGASSWSFGEYGTVEAGDVCIGDGVTVSSVQRGLVLTLMLAPMVWLLLSMTWHMILGKSGGVYPDGTE